MKLDTRNLTLVLLCLPIAGTCLADGYWWTNTVSGNWSVAGNWTNEAGAAVAPVSGGQANYTLSFIKAGTYTATHDLSTGFLLNRLNVGGPAFTLAGNGLLFTNNVLDLPQINQNGSSAFTISNSLALAADTTLGGGGSGQVTLSGTLSGRGSLTKTNAGQLTLNSLTNTFSGGLTINTGTVVCGNTANYLFGSGRVTVNPGAKLNLNGNNNITNALTLNAATIANGNSFSANWNGPIIVEATSAFDLGTTGNMTLGGKISGAGGVTKLGTVQGPLVITGSNSFTGPIAVNAGVLKVSSLNSVSGGTATSNLGAPIDVVNGTISLGSGSTAGTLFYYGSGETSDRIIKCSGATGGAILTQAGTASGLPTTRGISGLLKFSSNVSTPGVDGVDNRKTLTLTHATDANTGGTPGQGEISGNIGDSLLGVVGQRATSVTKAGVGTWTLSGANTYSGATRIQAGTLAFTRADALGTNVLDITDGAKAQLDYIGTRQIGALTFNAGAAQPNGSYGSSRSLATVKDDVHFSGLGTVTIGTVASPTTTALALTSGANPGAAGAVLTFTATVSGSTPTGNVIFFDGLTCIGTNILNSSFQASVSISTLAAGTHTLTALYTGGAGNASSASAPLSQTVTEGRLATTTTVARTAGSNPSAKGAAVTFTASVTGASPSGTVTFYDGDAAIGSGPLNGSGQASLAISSLTPGWRMITARYAGDVSNAPSASTASLLQTVNPSAGNGKLKVFILAGQSNMVGKGNVENGRDPNNLSVSNMAGGLGSLRNMLNTNPGKYGYLADPAHPIAGGSPGWLTRPDVWITYYGGSAWDITPPAPTPPYYTTKRKGDLDANFGQDAANGLIGPEYGFGLMVGSQLDDQVLIIKYAHGGRSLAVDFRPPTSVLNSGGAVGPCYSEMIGVVHQVLDNIAAEFPAYTGGGYEVVGLGWHQGWNDRINASYVAEYETNMVNLIKDLRTEFGAPNMRVSIGTTGMANADSDVNARNLITAQGNVANPTPHPELAGTVATVDTRSFDFGTLRGASGEGFHWNWSGESYFNIGESMGNAMMALLGSSAEATHTLVNVGATDITTNAATLNASLSCTGTNLAVRAYWNTLNGGTNTVLWTNSVAVGTYTNVTSSNVSVRVTGLAPNTSYFFTFRGTNATDNIWATEALGFSTLALPTFPPVIAGDSVTNVVMSEDSTPVPFSLTLNASDSDGDPLTWSVSTNALHGTATASGTGASKAVSYMPIANYSGADSFSVQVSDGQGGTDTITVNVTIQPVNDAPTTNGIVSQTVKDANNTGNASVVLDASTVSDVDGSIVSYTWSEGAVQLATGRVATVDFGVGVHSVTLMVQDDGGAVSTVGLTITVTAFTTYLSEDFEDEWADNALARTTNNWSSSGLADQSSITNPAVGYDPLPLGVPFPLAYNHTVSRRVLKVDTQGEALSTPALDAGFANAKVYVDMMAKFGVSEELPVAVSNDVTAKASIFFHAAGAITNLVVFHGQKSETGFGAPLFTSVSNGLDPNAWYRLTITLDATTNNAGAEAFSIRINGEPVISPLAYSDTWKTQIFNPSFGPDGGSWFLSASRRQGASGTNLTTFTGLTFDGEGLVDDLVVTPYQPTFTGGTVIMLALCTGSSDM